MKPLPTLWLKFLIPIAVGIPVITACQQFRRQPSPLEVTPDHANGIYAVGDVVGWTITPRKDSPVPPTMWHYTVRRNNAEVVKTGELDLSSGRARIETAMSEPAMVYVDLQSDSGGRPLALGAAVAPLKLTPSTPRPRDFDSFWKSKIEALEAVPANPVLTPAESGNPDVEFDILKMDHVDGGHVYGQIAKPKKPGKYPALLLLQWASPPYPLQPAWVVDRAAQGWLTLDIEPHDVLPNQPQSYYDALPRALKNYGAIGDDDRDKSYFVRMYLADYRAVEYLASRPDWDGKTLVVMGTSMGGQQSLCVAGLDHRITHVIVDEPSGCDMNAALHGRQEGYPNFPSSDPKVMETARYVDVVNFASRIRAKALVAMGFVDTVAPPAGIWTAFNQIRSPKEAAPMMESPHNNTATHAEQLPFISRSEEWLNDLVSGRKVTPRGRD